MRLFGTGKSSIYVNEGNIQNAPQLAVLHKSGFAKYWDSSAFVSFLVQRNMICLLAHQEGKGTNHPVGFVLFRTASDEAEIITICTDPEHRGHGIGYQLMTEAIVRMRREGVERLYLEVDENNASAMRLYKSLGLVVIATREGYYSHDGKKGDKKTAAKSNALVMELKLD